MSTLLRWIVLATFLCIGAFQPSVVARTANVPQPGAQAIGASSGCHDEQGLTYICDLVVPEDILTVGSTGLLLASGHRAPGHLYLIDPQRGRRSSSFTPQPLPYNTTHAPFPAARAR